MVHTIIGGRPCSVIPPPPMLWGGGRWPSVLVESNGRKRYFNRSVTEAARMLLGFSGNVDHLNIIIKKTHIIISCEDIFDLRFEIEKLDEIYFEVGFLPDEIDDNGLVKGSGGIDVFPSCSLSLRFKAHFQVPINVKSKSPKQDADRIYICFHVGTGGPAERLGSYVAEEINKNTNQLKTIRGNSFISWRPIKDKGW